MQDKARLPFSLRDVTPAIIDASMVAIGSLTRLRGGSLRVPRSALLPSGNVAEEISPPSRRYGMFNVGTGHTAFPTPAAINYSPKSNTA